MEARLTTETYFIDGQDEAGLIPEGVISVIVNYDDEGNPSLYYSAKPEKNISSPACQRTHEALLNRLNSQRPITSEGTQLVVGLLKKLSAE
jgi:hypothetical protein